VLLKNLTIAEAFWTTLSSENFVKRVSFVRRNSSKMARVWSTARVYREGEEIEATETAPISEVMERLGLVVTEEVVDEGAPDAEAEQIVAEEENVDESKEDYSILIPTKPSHLVSGTIIRGTSRCLILSW
jgi:nucleotide-binding universal stress UspA family protein